jgi:hypothetical protein
MIVLEEMSSNLPEIEVSRYNASPKIDWDITKASSVV